MSQNNANANVNSPAGVASSFTGNSFTPPEGTVTVDNSVYGVVSKLNEDEDLIRTNVEQSQGVGERMTNNLYRSCNDLQKNQDFRDTVGAKSLGPLSDGYLCPSTVDISSKYRVGVPKSCPKNRNQLFTRPYLTVPYMANGNLSTERMDIESELITGDYQMDPLPLSGVSTLDNVIVPLTKNLLDNVQNPVHLIEETADRLVPNNYRDAWIRGGIPTRQGVKDIDYLERSRDNDYVKELLVQNKGYLF